jgi:hypothetical protein
MDSEWNNLSGIGVVTSEYQIDINAPAGTTYYVLDSDEIVVVGEHGIMSMGRATRVNNGGLISYTYNKVSSDNDEIKSELEETIWLPE